MVQGRLSLETLYEAVSEAAQRLTSALAAESKLGSRLRTNGSKGHVSRRMPAARKFVAQRVEQYAVALRRYREAMETRFLDR
jgi:hypothetical protein